MIDVYRYLDHPDCIIEINRSGKMVFSPRESGGQIRLSEMVMPGRDFWEGLSSFFSKIEQENNDLRKQLALEKSANMELVNEAQSIKKKMVFVNSNRKQAFFAGMQAQKSICVNT